MRFEFHEGFRCWSLRRYADVLDALRDPSRFPISLIEGFDEAGHSRVLRDAMQAFDTAAWTRELEALPVDPYAVELVSGFAEPWSHSAACALFRVPPTETLPLARAVFAAGASPMDPSLIEPAERATQQLRAILPDGPLSVQAFVAISQTLAAFLSNAILHDASLSLEELLRRAGPSQAVFRFAAETMGAVPKGSRIALLLAEANRESASGHLAFGAGPHACVGAMLIRTAAAVALRRFRAKYARIAPLTVMWPEGVRAILSPTAIRIRED